MYLIPSLPAIAVNIKEDIEQVGVLTFCEVPSEDRSIDSRLLWPLITVFHFDKVESLVFWIL